MSDQELDRLVESIIQSSDKPTTIREIEKQVYDKSQELDTFDVQRAVKRLLAQGKAKLDSRLFILKTSA